MTSATKSFGSRIYSSVIDRGEKILCFPQNMDILETTINKRMILLCLLFSMGGLSFHLFLRDTTIVIPILRTKSYELQIQIQEMEVRGFSKLLNWVFVFFCTVT
jgi:hypothetical protein